MSTALAIAAVTATLKALLENGLTQNAWASAVGNPTVSALPPDRVVPATGTDPNQLNLFLYHVTPNPGWRNLGLPSRDRDGQTVANPPLALDLHYLVTAYGSEMFNAEILLGYAMQVLHETPGLGREAIRAALGAAGGSLAAVRRALATSELADQFEQLKITPQSMDTEEMSKLWTAFSTHYRPTAAYQVTVVLIESRNAARAPLPVLQRGLGDFGVAVQANLLPPVPTLVGLHPPNRQPAVRAGLHFDKLRLFGHHLAAAELTVEFQHLRLNVELAIRSTGPAAGVTLLTADATAAERAKDPSLQFADAGLEVDLSQATGWAAGVYRVDVRLGAPTDANAPVTNALTVAVAPEFVTTGPNAPAFALDSNQQPIIRLTCNPPVFRGQKVSFVVGDRELAGAPEFPAGSPPAPTTDQVVCQNALPDAWKGTTQPARLRTDGVEGLFILQPEGQPPQFDGSQSIAIPP
jgi:hypothetical protein